MWIVLLGPVRPLAACPKASGTGSSCGSAPQWPPRPRSRAGYSADGPSTATASLTPGRTPARLRPPTAGACTNSSPTPRSSGWSGGSSLSTLPGAACSPSPRGSPATPFPPRRSTTRPQPAPHRGRPGQERRPRHPGQAPLHRSASLEQAAQGRDPPRRQRRRPRLPDPAALERHRAVGLVRAPRPGTAGLGRGLRGRAGHHGRGRARPAGQP